MGRVRGLVYMLSAGIPAFHVFRTVVRLYRHYSVCLRTSSVSCADVSCLLVRVDGDWIIVYAGLPFFTGAEVA